jgi:uncharacterized protein (TIGR02391 family)
MRTWYRSTIRFSRNEVTMLLTNDELQRVRQTIETHSGLDGELIEHCGSLLYGDECDEAVQRAFVVLEERMRRLLKRDKATGYQMVQYAFSAGGPWTKLLTDQQEREGFQGLLTGAFKLYRNAAAHTIVGYERSEARGIISLIDLILKRLDDLATIHHELPPNIEPVLKALATQHGAPVAGRVRAFCARCVGLGLSVRTTKTWIPFRTRALVQRQNWTEPRRHMVTVFYLYTAEPEHGLWVPVSQYYSQVVGLNLEPFKFQLRELGFQTTGSYDNYYVSLNTHHSQTFLSGFFAYTEGVKKALEKTLG